MQQQIGFCFTTNGVRIAYATVGTGPALVVAELASLISDWNGRSRAFETSGRPLAVITGGPLRQAWLWSLRSEPNRLFARLRGSNHRGYRQRTGAKVFCALGTGLQGAAPAIAYAVKFPDRVSHLILYGAQARWHDSLPGAAQIKKPFAR